MEYHPTPECLPAMNIKNFLEDPEQKHWKGPFTFIHGADTQFGLIDRRLLRKLEHNWDKELKLTRDLIKRANEMVPKPKFIVVCGDILDAYPFETLPPYPQSLSGARELRQKQYNDFVDAFQELSPEIKLVCVCGNHDIGDIPSRSTLCLYREQFGQDYFSFWVGGVKFVVLNSQYFYCPEAIPEETEIQLNFLDTIADPQAKFIVVFQHIPFFLEKPDEDSSPITFPNMSKEYRFEMLEKLYNAGVRYLFCGHYHRNFEGRYKDMEVVITAAIGAPAVLGKDPSGYRVVNVTKDLLSHEYVKLRDSVEFDNEKVD